jgi:hypothetical protein
VLLKIRTIYQMKNILVIIALLILPLAGFAQGNNTTETAFNSRNQKVVAITPIKVKTTSRATHIQVDYKKSYDIISVKAYRKSLNVKVSTKELMC